MILCVGYVTCIVRIAARSTRARGHDRLFKKGRYNIGTSSSGMCVLFRIDIRGAHGRRTQNVFEISEMLWLLQKFEWSLRNAKELRAEHNVNVLYFSKFRATRKAIYIAASFAGRFCVKIYRYRSK